MKNQIEELYKLGSECFNNRDYLNAEYYYKQVLELDEKHKDSNYYLSRTYQELNKYDEAEQSFTKTLELEPNNKHARYNLGNVYFVQKKYSEAEVQYKKALEIDEKHLYSIHTLGRTYLELKRYSDAEYQFKLVLELDNENINAWYYLGILYYTQQNYAKAESWLKKVIHVNPDYKSVSYYLGRVYFFQKNFTSAEQHLKKALTQNEKDLYSNFYLGIIYISQVKDPSTLVSVGENEVNFLNCKKAIQYFDKTIAINPKHKDALCQLGFSSIILYSYDKSKSHTDKAMNCADLALEIDPDFSLAWGLKASTNLAIGKKLEAIECVIRSKDDEAIEKFLKATYLSNYSRIEPQWHTYRSGKMNRDGFITSISKDAAKGFVKDFAKGLLKGFLGL